MRVLLLTQAYPPEPLVGALRAQKVAKALAAAGHRVQLLMVTPSSEPERDLGIAIATVAPTLFPRLLYRGAHFLAHKTSRGVRRALADLVSVPDTLRGAVPALRRAALAMPEPDLLYSTSPSHSMHVAAVALKRRWACPWIAEFRDPWPMPPPSALATRYSRWLERQVLQSVAGVVTVAPGAARLYRAKLNWLPEDRIVMAMNGVDTIAARREPRAPHRVLDVVYSGSLYPPRSLLPQLQAFAALRRAGALPPMRIVLLGECRLYGETDMPAACAELGLADVVEFRGWVPAEESRRIVAQADLLLLPAQEWRHQIPNKLFDYLGARVPIFALCEPDSDPAELLETAGGHFVAYGENPGTLTATLRAALEAAKIGSAASRLDLLDELSVESQMRRLVQWTEHLVRVAGGAAGPPSGHDSAGSAA